MKDLFTRSTLNPILRPNNEWWKIYNPAAALADDGIIHLFPRVMKKEEDWHSLIVHASSTDGEHFNWDTNVVLARQDEKELRGLEDPRVTRIGNTYYMTFAAYGGGLVQLHTAIAENLNGPWYRQGVALPTFDFVKSGGRVVYWEKGKPIEKDYTGETYWSKSGGLFPQKINDKFLLLFGEFCIWFATSENGVLFETDPQPLIGPRKGTSYFDNTFIEMGPPPILTEKGWLVLYHGIDETFRYQLGFLILDSEDPHQIVYRCEEPIFGPQEEYEIGDALIDVIEGGVTAMQKMNDEELKTFYKKAREENVMPQVVFCPGAIVKEGNLLLYYGAGDTSICTASAPLQDILKLVL